MKMSCPKTANPTNAVNVMASTTKASITLLLQSLLSIVPPPITRCVPQVRCLVFRVPAVAGADLD